MIPPIAQNSSFYDDLVYAHMDLNFDIHYTAGSSHGTGSTFSTSKTLWSRSVVTRERHRTGTGGKILLTLSTRISGTVRLLESVVGATRQMTSKSTTEDSKTRSGSTPAPTTFGETSPSSRSPTSSSPNSRAQATTLPSPSTICRITQ